MIFKILGKLIFLASFMMASVDIQVQDEFVAGDAVSFSIKAKGSDIEFPQISTIDKFDVQDGGSRNNITIINGKRSEQRVKIYKFYPNKTVTIPAFKVMVDGKEFFTDKKTVQLKQISKTRSNKYDLSIKVNKNKVYVGEGIELTLQFKYNREVNIVDIGFTDPVFENFWSKQYDKPVKYQSGHFVVQELKYLLFPQKAGNLKIDPLKIDMVLAENPNSFSFFSQGINKRLYSNELNIEVEPLPDGVKLIGSFNIKTKINKTKVQRGQAVSYSVSIDGRGNLDDLDDIKLQLPNATIYENKAQKKYNVDISGEYGGTYSKSFSIVAQNDFTIPSIQIKYFDKKSNKIKTIKSKSYNIKVFNPQGEHPNKTNQLQKIETKQTVKEKVVIKTIDSTTKDKVIYFILGMVVMLLLVFSIKAFMQYKAKNDQEELPLIVKIKRSKTSDQLLKNIVAYIGIDQQLDKTIYELEQNKDIEFRLKKKEIITIVKSLQLDKTNLKGN